MWKKWTAILPVLYSLKSTFRQISGPYIETPWNQWLKSNFDKSYEVADSNYDEFVWNLLIQITKNQSRAHFKNLNWSAASLIFAKLDLYIKFAQIENPWNRWLKSNLDYKVAKLLIQETSILLSVAWTFQKCGMQYCQLNIRKNRFFYK